MLLTTARLEAGLREASAAFAAYAGRAGLDAPVPTCPGWTVRDLVADADQVHLTAAERPQWARRQCHAMTLRAIDAQGAALGRPARPEELWVDPELAVDGIDELLGWRRLRCEDDALLVVRLQDRADWWTVELGAGPPYAVHHVGGTPPEADWELIGSAVELYLRLWDRAGPAIDESGRRVGSMTHATRMRKDWST